MMNPHEDSLTQGKHDYLDLRSLASQTGHNLYDMVAIADRLLKNRDWVEAIDCGGGSITKAIDRLEHTCFAFAGIGLPELLEVYHNVPDPEAWHREHYNVRKLYAQWQAQQRPKAPTPKASRPAPRSLPSPVEFSNLAPAKAVEEYNRSLNLIQHKQDEVQKLRARVAELEQENAQLKEQIKKLKSRIVEAVRATA